MEEVTATKPAGADERTDRVALTIAGSFGFGNAGDEGVPLALSDMARSIGVALDIELLGRFDDPALPGVIGLGEADAASRQAISTRPVLFVGGGIVEPQPKAAVSRTSPWLKRAGVPYAALFGAGVESRVEYNWRNRRRLVSALKRMSRLFVRDVVSAVELSRIMPAGDIETIGDVILWLEPGRRPAELDGIDRYIAVNLSPRWTDEPGWPQWIAEQLLQVSRRFDAPLVFVPCTQRHDRDQEEHELVAGLLRQQSDAPQVVCIGDGYGPREIAGAIGGALLTIAMRLHACVMSYAQQVPWVALAYHPKLSGFAATVEQPFRLLPPDLPAQQSADAYGYTFSSMNLADCDLERAAVEAVEQASFHRLQPLRETLVEALRTVLAEAAPNPQSKSSLEVRR